MDTIVALRRSIWINCSRNSICGNQIRSKDAPIRVFKSGFELDAISCTGFGFPGEEAQPVLVNGRHRERHDRWSWAAATISAFVLLLALVLPAAASSSPNPFGPVGFSGNADPDPCSQGRRRSRRRRYPCR